VASKGGKKKKQDSVRVRAQPTRMLLSAHLISIEVEQSPGENG
jgi:hypothetical protein